MPVYTKNPITGAPIDPNNAAAQAQAAKDAGYKGTLQSNYSTPAAHPLMMPGGGFNATWQDPYVGSQQTNTQQPTNTLSNLLSAPAMPARPSLDGGGAQQSAAPAANPFAHLLQQQFTAPRPVAPTAAPLQQMALPTAPTLRSVGISTTTPQLSAAEQRLQDLITNPGALQDSASYKFRFNQGQEALQRSLGARGLLNSGNRLTELTKYGQDVGSQEYEAENARRAALLGQYQIALAAENQSRVAAGSANNTAANALYGTQMQGATASNATAAQARAAADTMANNQYLAQLDALLKQQGTLANLYSNADSINTQRYGIDTTAGTARGNTLADLYRTDVGATTDLYKTKQQTALGYADIERQKQAPKPWWQA